VELKERLIELLEQDRVHSALALTLDRLAMAPDDLDAKASLALAWACGENWRAAKVLMEEVLKEDPDNELALATLLVVADPTSASQTRELVGPGGLKLGSRWFRIFAKLGNWGALNKITYLMVTDPEARVRADFMENAAPWFHDKAREVEEKEAREKEKGEARSGIAARRHPSDFEP